MLNLTWNKNLLAHRLGRRHTHNTLFGHGELKTIG